MFGTMHFVAAFILVVNVALVEMQGCRARGKRCVDDEQCCGGCCIEGECIDTFRPCYMPFDLCRSHACLGEETCIVYIPPECPGCEPMALCKLL